MDWIENFAGLRQLEDAVRRTLVERSRIIEVPKDTIVFGPGKAPDNLLLLLDGTLRVQQVSEGGREIVLYRVHAGESCVLTTACLLAYEEYSAEGVTETDVKAVAIPKTVFDDLIAGSAAFRRFVFTAYSRRITDIFLVIEEVAFRRVDIRLALKLLDLAGSGDSIRATHQQLATELGTAREVVSRLLQEFQRRGWVALSRGSVELIDRAGLRELSSAD